MKIYDLTLPLSVSGSVFPGTPKMSYTLSHTVEKDHYNLGLASINSHAGTHTDAPHHFLEEGVCLDKVPVTKYVGYAVVADLTGKGALDTIDVSDLLPYEDKIRAHRKVILHTNWSEHAAEDIFYTDYPVITEALARWLTGLGVEMIGVEAPSLNPGKYIEVHKTFLSGAPIPLAEADGFPIRAVAIEF